MCKKFSRLYCRRFLGHYITKGKNASGIMMKWLLIVKWVLNQNQITEDFRIETFSKASGGRRIPVKLVADDIGQSNLRKKNQVQQFLMQAKEKWSKLIYVWVSCHGTGLPCSVPRQQKQLERILLLEVLRRQLPKSHCSSGEGHRDCRIC